MIGQNLSKAVNPTLQGLELSKLPHWVAKFNSATSLFQPLLRPPPLVTKILWYIPLFTVRFWFEYKVLLDVFPKVITCLRSHPYWRPFASKSNGDHYIVSLVSPELDPNPPGQNISSWSHEGFAEELTWKRRREDIFASYSTVWFVSASKTLPRIASGILVHKIQLSYNRPRLKR